jgi:hypothetical protein
VLALILLVIMLWIVMAILLTAWSLWFQGYLYSEPATGLPWRGPAASSALVVVLLLWIVLDYRSPGRYRPLLEFSSSEDSQRFPELRIPKADTKDQYEVYQLRQRNGEYRLDGKPNGKLLPQRPDRIMVIEEGEKSIFEPERDAKGNFKVQTSKSFMGEGSQYLRYIDGKGRVMVETSLGKITTFHGGWLFVNLMFNFLLLAVWFVVLWLVMRFQWTHALGQSFVFWGVMLVFVLPPMLSRVEEVAKQRVEARRLAG